jgi:hypothetical protein
VKINITLARESRPYSHEVDQWIERRIATTARSRILVEIEGTGVNLVLQSPDNEPLDQPVAPRAKTLPEREICKIWEALELQERIEASAVINFLHHLIP